MSQSAGIRRGKSVFSICWLCEEAKSRTRGMFEQQAR